MMSVDINSSDGQKVGTPSLSFFDQYDLKKIGIVVVIVFAIIVLIVLFGVKLLAKSSPSKKTPPFITVTPTTNVLSPSPVPSLPSPQNDWELRIEKTVYSAEELIPTPGGIPRTGGLSFLVTGKIFGPYSLNDQTICEHDNNTYVETKQGDAWVRLCDAQIPSSSPPGFYCVHNEGENYEVFGFLDSKNQCDIMLDQPESGTYRIRSEIFAECQKDENGRWDNSDSELCKIHKILFSPQFEIK